LRGSNEERVYPLQADSAQHLLMGITFSKHQYWPGSCVNGRALAVVRPDPNHEWMSRSYNVSEGDVSRKAGVLKRNANFRLRIA
jgi:hypothetical protein